jgi:UDP-N-acetylmuramoyl-L-alanyl-D-glutamate--2,6-diaminopimelate ligase
MKNGIKMKLKKVVNGIPLSFVKGPLDLEIQSVTANSKEVGFGALFLAKKGGSFDGKEFIKEAIASGACAIVTETFDPFLKGVTQIVSPSLEIAEEIIVKNFFEIASFDLLKIGVTGTNGKTTTSFLIKGILDLLKGPCGLIGTVEYIVGDHHFPATRTTPDLFTNHKLLEQMGKEGCRSCVMEVTSHALVQNRCYGIEFDAAIFTNLTQDHLDYHKTMENYAKAKSRLFTDLKQDKVAIVNQDSDYLDKILENCTAEVMTYGLFKADVLATDLKFSSLGTQFKVHFLERSVEVFSPLLGQFNVYNGLAAIAFALRVLRVPLEEIPNLVSKFPQVPGRLERVKNDLGLSIFVDFAHTEDGLKNVLETIRALKPQKIITVFGCGGDRDRGKRPKMGRVAAQLSDVVIVTSDNPRTEKEEEIAYEILVGCPEALVILNRREAIRYAISQATPDDVVLIAGKGHEKGQTIGFVTTPFDDVLEAKEFCQTLSSKEILC